MRERSFERVSRRGENKRELSDASAAREKCRNDRCRVGNEETRPSRPSRERERERERVLQNEKHRCPVGRRLCRGLGHGLAPRLGTAPSQTGVSFFFFFLSFEERKKEKIPGLSYRSFEESQRLGYAGVTHELHLFAGEQAVRFQRSPRLFTAAMLAVAAMREGPAFSHSRVFIRYAQRAGPLCRISKKNPCKGDSLSLSLSLSKYRCLSRRFSSGGVETPR